MLTRDIFELIGRRPNRDLYFEPADAGPTLDDPPDLHDEARELDSAFERLAADPSIRSTTHEGVFTYEDPVLANAALFGRLKEGVGKFLDRPEPGEELASYRLWMLMGVKWFLSRLRPDPPLRDLGGMVACAPVMMPASPLRIAVVGDAGQFGNAQEKVLRMIGKIHAERAFHAVIHLGDVYFAASVKEMSRNFLAPFSALRHPNCPVYTLCGNHDLYYGAEAYLGALKILNQPGRYFVIENDHWRLACLDTSYGAASILKNDGRLDDGQLIWLRHLMGLRDKRLVLFSHHFIISGWDTPADSLCRMLAEDARDAVFAWYWGHEHRAAVYDRGSHGFFGACVGNGAFPETWSKPLRSIEAPGAAEPAWYSQARCQCFGGKSEYCPHGFLELELHADHAIETVHLEHNEQFASRLTAQLREPITHKR